MISEVQEKLVLSDERAESSETELINIKAENKDLMVALIFRLFKPIWSKVKIKL